jgi:integrase
MAVKKVRSKSRKKRRERPHKKYQAEYWFRDSNGKNHRLRKRFNTQNEADDWVVQGKRNRRKGCAPKSANRTIDEAIGWLKSTERWHDLSPKSKSSYHGRLNIFREFCAKVGITHLHQINRQFGEDYVRFLKTNYEGEGISSKINIATLIINEELKRDDSVLTGSPIAGIRRPRSGSKRIRYLSDKELECLWSVMDEYELSVFELVLNLGLRVDEYQNLTWAQVQHDPLRIEIVEHDGWRPKWELERTLPLNDYAKSSLLYFQNRTASQKYVFNLRSDKKLGHNYVNNLYSKVKARAIKMAPSLVDTTAKTLRATCGSLMLQSGESFESVGAFLGHRGTKTTIQHYASMNIKNQIGASKSLANFTSQKSFRHLDRDLNSKSPQD